MKKSLIIIGTGGHAKVCLDIAEKMNRWDNISFLTEEPAMTTFMGYEVLGGLDKLPRLHQSIVFVAVGNLEKRKAIMELLNNENMRTATLVHPSTVIAKNVIINPGTVIMAGVIINSDTVIGQGCIVNTGSTVDHDNQIGDYSHISPGVHLAGGVRIGTNVWVGVGANVINNISICSGCIIGAGATVIKDINEEGTYIGIPATCL